GAGLDAVPRDLAGRARSDGAARRDAASRTLGRVAARAVHQREHQARLGLGARVNAAGIALRVAETDDDYEAWRRVRIDVLPYERAGSVEEMRRADAPDKLLLLAELDGEIAGCGVAGRSDLPGYGFVAPPVRPGPRRRG